MTKFQGRVYELVAQVPNGRVTTYGEVARKLGGIHFSRAVGQALNKNRNPQEIPCHRVVRSDGRTGGYAWGQTRKKKILSTEGIKVKMNRIERIDQVLWRFK